MSAIAMVWAAKKPAKEPCTGFFSGPLTARCYLLFLVGPLQVFESPFIFLSNVTEVL